MDPLEERLVDGSAVVAGVLSGTSVDGIDVALARFEGGGESSGRPEGVRGIEALGFATHPFPDGLGERVRAAIDGQALDLRGVALLHRDLGHAFGCAAREVAEGLGLTLDLVGSHGQTLWHHDGDPACGPASLQLGDGDFVAEAAGCPVVSDFRQGDLAAGGQGAPIAALADADLFPGLPRPSAILNLGGISNLTLLLDPEGPARPWSFDVGAAGCLLDGMARRLLDRPMDPGGARAQSGREHDGVLATLLDHPFLGQPPPKSTGRDTFDGEWVDRVLSELRGQGVELIEDLLATSVAWVAESIARALLAHGPPNLNWLVVAGGGVHNGALLDSLARRVPQPVASSEDFGVDPDAREALAFAALARSCVLRRALGGPELTGAEGPRVLGKLSRR